MPHEKGQGAAFSFDNLNHSWLGAVELATFMLERVISQLRGLVGFALGTRNLHMPIALSVLLVLAGYYAGSIVGIQLGLPPSGIGATWPPTAILLAALLLAPPRYWWMYLLGVVPAHLHVVASFQLPEVPFVVMLCQVGSNILLAVLAAFALRSLIGAPPQLGNHRNMGAFILLAVLATAVASAVAVWLFLLTGWAADFWLVWRQRVLANVFSIITIPPVIVLAFAGQLVGAHATWRSYLELALITVGVLVVGIPVFGLDSPGPSNSARLAVGSSAVSDMGSGPRGGGRHRPYPSDRCRDRPGECVRRTRAVHQSGAGRECVLATDIPDRDLDPNLVAGRPR